MFPAFEMRNMGLADPVFLGKFGLFLGAGADFQNVCIRQFPIPMVQAVVVAALNRCVFVVVVACSKAKMFWVHARRIVASVQNYLPFRDLANKHLVGKTVSPNGALARKKNDSVPVSVLCSLPNPASSCLSYSTKKNILWAYLLELVQCAFVVVVAIARAAQLSANRFLVAAKNAGNSVSLVTHRASMKGSSIFHIHGGA